MKVTIIIPIDSDGVISLRVVVSIMIFLTTLTIGMFIVVCMK